MEAHHLSFERRQKSSEVRWQGCTLRACSRPASVWPSPSSRRAVGVCAGPSAIHGLHQPGLLHLQLLLRVAELQARGAQEGLQGGEAPRWEGGGDPCSGGHLEPRPDGGHAVPLGEAQPPLPCPSWTHMLKCLCVCVCMGVGVCDGRGEYSKKPTDRVACRSTALRLHYQAHSPSFPPTPSAHLLTWCVVPDFLQFMEIVMCPLTLPFIKADLYHLFVFPCLTYLRACPESAQRADHGVDAPQFLPCGWGALTDPTPGPLHPRHPELNAEPQRRKAQRHAPGFNRGWEWIREL